MLKEFKAFIMKGNVLDLAVAVIIGAAFSAIVKSLVADVITPLLLKPAMEAMGVARLEELVWNETVLYGKFLVAILNFLIVAFCIFMVIKGFEKMKKKEEEKPAAPAAPPAQEVLLTEIRDLLKKD